MRPQQEKALADLAQDMVYDAWEMSRKRDRVAQARKALAVWRDTADALMLLAEEAAASADERLELTEQAVEAGRKEVERRLPKAGDSICWWGELETRPYMRALFGLARAKWASGHHQDAVSLCEDLLARNPQDNQGVRYHLMHFLVALRDGGRMAHLLRDHLGSEGAAEALYPKALWAYLSSGPSPQTDFALQGALGSNPWVPAYLLGAWRLPSKLPDAYTLGSKEQAACYARDLGFMWRGAYPELSRAPWQWERDSEGQTDCPGTFVEGPSVSQQLRHWLYEGLVGLRGIRLSP